LPLKKIHWSGFAGSGRASRVVGYCKGHSECSKSLHIELFRYEIRSYFEISHLFGKKQFEISLLSSYWTESWSRDPLKLLPRFFTWKWRFPRKHFLFICFPFNTPHFPSSNRLSNEQIQAKKLRNVRSARLWTRPCRLSWSQFSPSRFGREWALFFSLRSFAKNAKIFGNPQGSEKLNGDKM
jgi:hypothetical protein